MANIVTTDIDVGEVGLGDNTFEDGLFNGADVLAKGTILARDTTNQKFQLYVKDGSTNGNGVPIGVLTYAVTTVAGDNPIRLCMTGRVNKRLLVIDADQDNSNIDGQVLDELRQTGLVAEDVSQLSLDDNVQQVDS